MGIKYGMSIGKVRMPEILLFELRFDKLKIVLVRCSHGWHVKRGGLKNKNLQKIRFIIEKPGWSKVELLFFCILSPTVVSNEIIL